MLLLILLISWDLNLGRTLCAMGEGVVLVENLGTGIFYSLDCLGILVFHVFAFWSSSVALAGRFVGPSVRGVRGSVRGLRVGGPPDFLFCKSWILYLFFLFSCYSHRALSKNDDEQ